MHTYNQDLVSVVVAHCIFYAPKVCSHCSRCCLLLYNTAHGYSPELCKRSRHVPQIMTFVFPAFTPNPFFSMASFFIKSLLTHSSRESLMMTRSSAYTKCMSSQGPARNSHDKASSTMMKSIGNEYGSLVDPDHHLKLFAETLANTNPALRIVHSLD